MIVRREQQKKKSYHLVLHGERARASITEELPDVILRLFLT
jgi:hypothetical protein